MSCRLQSPKAVVVYFESRHRHPWRYIWAPPPRNHRTRAWCLHARRPRIVTLLSILLLVPSPSTEVGRTAKGIPLEAGAGHVEVDQSQDGFYQDPSLSMAGFRYNPFHMLFCLSCDKIRTWCWNCGQLCRTLRTSLWYLDHWASYWLFKKHERRVMWRQ
jgi:hypothetical protein